VLSSVFCFMVLHVLVENFSVADEVTANFASKSRNKEIKKFTTGKRKIILLKSIFRSPCVNFHILVKAVFEAGSLWAHAHKFLYPHFHANTWYDVLGEPHWRISSHNLRSGMRMRARRCRRGGQSSLHVIFDEVLKKIHLKISNLS